MPRAAATLLGLSPFHAVAEWRGHTLAIFENTPTVDGAREVTRAVERLALSQPGRSAYLAILRPFTSLPDEEIRRMYVDLGRKVSGSLNCVGVTIEGEGFIAAALRGLVTGLALTAKTSFPVRSYSSLPEMAAWARSRVVAAGGSFGTDSELQDAFAYLKAQLQSLRSDPSNR